MKRRLGLGITLAICAVAEGAEPSASTPVLASPAPSVKAAAAPVPNITPADKPVPAKPLDLRVGHVRSYMMPNEYQAVLDVPDADANTVVVEGRRELLPFKSEAPIPGGLAAPFWALAHPLQGLRIFLPIAKTGPDRPREPEDRIPPREFRWGP